MGDEAKELALRVLAFHARTEAQLRARLARAGFERETAEVLDWLRRLGYLDDGAYARARAKELLRGGRLGPSRALAKLRAEGVDAEPARDALLDALAATSAAPAADPDAAVEPCVDRAAAELALCREALGRKLRGADPAALPQRERARAARFLLGRGFAAAAVSKALGVGRRLMGVAHFT